jgi:FkbM family methyltransferase
VDGTGALRRKARRTAARLFGAVGLEVHRRRPLRPRGTTAEVLAHLKAGGLEPATVIDVGVGYGTVPLYEAFPAARLVLIEPLAEFEGTLDRLARTYGAELVRAAAGAGPGTATMHVSPYLEGSSLLTENVDIGGMADREVPMVTIDATCERLGLLGPFLIKVDVQGGELEVLDGAAETLPAAEAVILEVSLFRFMEGGPDLADVVAYMKARGFAAYDIWGGHLRPLDRALAQVDMAFVHERGRFRRSHAYRVP